MSLVGFRNCVDDFSLCVFVVSYFVKLIVLIKLVKLMLVRFILGWFFWLIFFVLKYKLKWFLSLSLILVVMFCVEGGFVGFVLFWKFFCIIRLKVWDEF